MSNTPYAPWETAEIDPSLVDDSEAEGSWLVVRVKTEWWHDNNGLYQRKCIKFMKRVSKGAYNILKEDSDNIGAEEVFCAITNIDECDDGLYTVNTTNVQHEWETGCVDSYDYVLIPYKPKTP
jgi:hypothetical protein